METWNYLCYISMYVHNYINTMYIHRNINFYILSIHSCECVNDTKNEQVPGICMYKHREEDRPTTTQEVL